MDIFYESDNKFYIVINHQPVEVCEEIYKAYKKIEYNTRYLDRKFYRFNKSLDADNLIAAKYEYIASKNEVTIEACYELSESDSEFMSKFSAQDRLIIAGLINGLTEKQIAQKLGVSQQYINKRRKKIKELL